MFLKNITILLFFLCLVMNVHISNASKLYELSFTSIDGEEISFSEYKNKVILIVNTASFCGFTRQYFALQELWEKYKKDNFVLIGFPSDDFGQEAKSNEDVKRICEIDFKINFPIAEISSVKGEDINLIFKFIIKELGSNSSPKWNFYKYLINKNGKPVNWFVSLTSPRNKHLIKEIEFHLRQ